MRGVGQFGAGGLLLRTRGDLNPPLHISLPSPPCGPCAQGAVLRVIREDLVPSAPLHFMGSFATPEDEAAVREQMAELEETMRQEKELRRSRFYRC